MGADLIAAHLAIPFGIKPDFDAARAKVTGMTDLEIATAMAEVDCDNLADYLRWRFDIADPTAWPEKQRNEIRTTANNAIETVEDAWNDHRRDAVSFEVANHIVMVTGEMTWGDCPDGVYDFTLFTELGLCEVTGFCDDRSKQFSNV